MENEIVMQFEGLKDERDTQRILRHIQGMPGIELVNIDSKSGYVRVMGGDVDTLFLSDTIEGMGFPLIR